VLHVMDLVPTFLEMAGVELPAEPDGTNSVLAQGKSMWPLLDGRESKIRTESDWLGWELFGNRAIRQGDWKLLYLLPAAGGIADWQLFNLKNDPAELHDRSVSNSNKRADLLRLWDEYVKRNGVIVSEAGPFARREP